MAITGSFFHVGVVVPDLEEARRHLTGLLGVEWGPLVELDIAKRDAAGNDLTLPLRVCYSTEAPRLELIEEIPGSVWQCNEHSNLHHVGFWSDALTDDIAALEAARCPLQLSGRDGDTAPVQSAYHRDPLGFTVELVDAANRPLLEQSMFRAAPG
jgi:catechol 2,3-dioxygenase-like lactoylglutathione lyase family enzyme